MDQRLGAALIAQTNNGSNVTMEALTKDDGITVGSGNVFADLGVAEPEEELAKAQLASHIRHHQAAAADPGAGGGTDRR